MRIQTARRLIQRLRDPNTALSTYVEFAEASLASIASEVDAAKRLIALIIRRIPSVQIVSEEIEPTLSRILTALVREIVRIESRFYFEIDTLVPYLRNWALQANDEDVTYERKLLEIFTNDLITEVGLNERAILVFTDQYACHSCLLEGGTPRGHVVSAPFSEFTRLGRWVVIAHEIGHGYFDYHWTELESEVAPSLAIAIRELRPDRRRESQLATEIWLGRWIPELIADCLAVKLVGPSFTLQFMSDAIHDNPFFVEELEPTHPPPATRLSFQLQILRFLDLPGFDLPNLESRWSAYVAHVQYAVEPFVQFLLSPQIVEYVTAAVQRIVSVAPIRRIWPDILDAKSSLLKHEVGKVRLMPLICALGLLPSTFDANWVLDDLKAEGS